MSEGLVLSRGRAPDGAQPARDSRGSRGRAGSAR